MKDWSPSEALEHLLDVERSDYSRCGPREFINAVLDFANEQDKSLLLQRYLFLSGNRHSIRLVSRPGVDASATGIVDVASKEQKWTQAKLVAIKDGTPPERLELARELIEEADRVVLFPKTEVVPSKKGVSIRTTYVFETDSSASVISRGLIHLLDTSENLIDILCRCRLQYCRRWFLGERDEERRSKPGRTRSVYCSPEHSLMAERDRKREEATKRRAKVRAEKLKKLKTKRVQK